VPLGRLVGVAEVDAISHRGAYRDEALYNEALYAGVDGIASLKLRITNSLLYVAGIRLSARPTDTLSTFASYVRRG
jgi:hypothetical protein